MRYVTIAAALLALAGCQTPEQRADAICGQRGNPPGCFSAVYNALLQSQAVNSTAMMNTGAAMMAAGSAPAFQPAPMPIQRPVTCRTLGAGAVQCF